MKLRDVKDDVMLFELRREIGNKLFEDIEGYLSKVLQLLKNKAAGDLFKPGSTQLDLEKLTNIVAGLKILGNETYRDAMTKDDIGLNPRSAAELLKLLNDIPDTGKLPSDVERIFKALVDVAPAAKKKVEDELGALKSTQQDERQAAIDGIAKLTTKVSQLFNRLKHKTTQGDAAGKPETK